MLEVKRRMCQSQRTVGQGQLEGHDIGRWAHDNVKLHFYSFQEQFWLIGRLFVDYRMYWGWPNHRIRLLPKPHCLVTRTPSPRKFEVFRSCLDMSPHRPHRNLILSSRMFYITRDFHYNLSVGSVAIYWQQLILFKFWLILVISNKQYNTNLKWVAQP